MDSIFVMLKMKILDATAISTMQILLIPTLLLLYVCFHLFLGHVLKFEGFFFFLLIVRL